MEPAYPSSAFAGYEVKNTKIVRKIRKNLTNISKKGIYIGIGCSNLVNLFFKEDTNP